MIRKFLLTGAAASSGCSLGRDPLILPYRSESRAEPSPWEAWLAAMLFQEAGEPGRGVDVFLEALERYPGNPNVLYNLACFESLAGRADEALVHLSEAIELRPEMKEWAQTDSDFDAIRGDPRFPR